MPYNRRPEDPRSTWKATNPKRSADRTWSTRASTSIMLVMYQRKPNPHPKMRAEQINQLALTFGTLLSSQRSNAHPQKPLDLPGGNLINATGWPARFQLRGTSGPSESSGARAPPSPLPEVTFRIVLPGSTQALQVSLLPVRISVGNKEKVTGMLQASQICRSVR